MFYHSFSHSTNLLVPGSGWELGNEFWVLLVSHWDLWTFNEGLSELPGLLEARSFAGRRTSARVPNFWNRAMFPLEPATVNPRSGGCWFEPWLCYLWSHGFLTGKMGVKICHAVLKVWVSLWEEARVLQASGTRVQPAPTFPAPSLRTGKEADTC